MWFGALGLATGLQQLRGELQRPLQQAARAMDLRPGDRVWATGDTQLIDYYLDLDPIVPVAAFPPNLAKEAIVRPLVRAGLMAGDGPCTALELPPRYVVTRDPQPPGNSVMPTRPASPKATNCGTQEQTRSSTG